jgi:diguanylate cyclase (GGDEF)-like protein/PAS domain S-box-containing protein
MGRRWSRVELRTFVSGRLVHLRDREARELPVPAWLAEAAGEVGTRPSAERLAATHTEDRSRTIAGLFEALERPGEVVEVDVRIEEDDGWTHERINWLNLLDHPDIGAFLYTAERVPGPPIVLPVEDGDLGEGDETGWLLAHLDAGALVTSVEGRCLELTGYSADELIGHTLLEFVHPDSLADSLLLWLDMRLRPGAVRTTRRCWIRRGGSELWVESSYVNRMGDDGSGDVLVITWDISARRAQEAALEQSREDLRSLADDFRMLADEVPAGVFRCDADGVVDFHNARWTELVGGATRVHDAFHPDHWPVLDAELRRLLTAPGDDRTNLELGAADCRRVLALTSRAVGGGGDRARQHVVGAVNDVTDQVALRRSATHDVLTGLLNRQAIEERLARALAVAPDGMIVMFLDLDGFKGVNDDYGHDIGDLVLRTLGRRLTDALRPDDAVGRFGGDEFVVVCENGGDVDDHIAAEIAERLEQALSAPIPFPGGSWSPTASIGTARPRPGEDLSSVLRRADQAMYAVKRHRRGSGQAPAASGAAAPYRVSPPR